MWQCAKPNFGKAANNLRVTPQNRMPDIQVMSRLGKRNWHATGFADGRLSNSGSSLKFHKA